MLCDNASVEFMTKKQIEKNGYQLQSYTTM